MAFTKRGIVPVSSVAAARTTRYSQHAAEGRIVQSPSHGRGGGAVERAAARERRENKTEEGLTQAVECDITDMSQLKISSKQKIENLVNLEMKNR